LTRLFPFEIEKGENTAMNIKSVIVPILLVISLAVLPGAALSDAGDNTPDGSNSTEEKTLSPTLNPGLNHLLALVQPDGSSVFNMETIEPVLKFVASPKDGDRVYVADKSFGASSAYIEVDLNRSMSDILKISYNPALPTYFVTPSSVRLGYWKTFHEGERHYDGLWSLLPDLESPIVVRGVETIENTPDIHTGAYYKYDLERTMILYRHKGKKVFVSLSQQIGHSLVGKKGLVLGDDREWNYLYSGEKGINKMGLGWVDSYMYDSSSIIVFFEIEPGLVRCAVFKWLRAGWKNINMVKNHHIYKGMKRFAHDYKTIIEHPSLPGTDELAAAWSRIESMDLETLKAINRQYFQALEAHYTGDKSVSSKWSANLLKDHSRVDTSDVHELRSVLVVEYLKSVLGKKPEIDVQRLYAGQ